MPSFEKIPSIFREPVFERAFETAEIAAMIKDEIFAYEMSLKVLRDNFSALKTAQMKSEARGRAKGKAEVALEMKKDGVALKTIAKYTGLSLDEIKKIVID